MPNRYIRASAIESEPVNSLSWQGEVFYRRLLNRVDDFGRYTANLDLLRAAIFPLQITKVSVSDIARLLKECENAGLVFGYEDKGKPYLVMNKWEKGRAVHSEYPEPPANILEQMKTFAYRRKQGFTDVPDSDSDSDSDSANNARIIIHLLNEQTGKHFRETETSMKPIIERLKEKDITFDGVKQMVQRQVKLWKGTEMEEYLRPETLFGKTKFNSYYAAKDAPLPTPRAQQKSAPQIEENPLAAWQ